MQVAFHGSNLFLHAKVKGANLIRLPTGIVETCCGDWRSISECGTDKLKTWKKVSLARIANGYHGFAAWFGAMMRRLMESHPLMFILSIVFVSFTILACRYGGQGILISVGLGLSATSMWGPKKKVVKQSFPLWLKKIFQIIGGVMLFWGLVASVFWLCNEHSSDPMVQFGAIGALLALDFVGAIFMKLSE